MVSSAGEPPSVTCAITPSTSPATSPAIIWSESLECMARQSRRGRSANEGESLRFLRASNAGSAWSHAAREHEFERENAHEEDRGPRIGKSRRRAGQRVPEARLRSDARLARAGQDER